MGAEAGILIAIGVWFFLTSAIGLSMLHEAVNSIKQQKAVNVELNPYVKGQELTTVLPIPVAAIECKHDWEEVSRQVLETPTQHKFLLVLKCPICGVLDKTIQTTDKPPALPAPTPPRSECRHDWEDKKAVILESAFEQVQELISQRFVDTSKIKIPEMDRWAFQKTYVKERICRKCGEIHTIKASNFDKDEEA